MELEEPESHALAQVPPATAKVRASRTVAPVRFGPCAVSSAAVAWGISLTAHAAVIVAGIIAVRNARRDAAPEVALAQGDGGGDTGFFFSTSGASAASVPDTLASNTPAAVPSEQAAPDSGGHAPAALDPLVPEEVSDAWVPASEPAVMLAEAETTDTGPIGLPAASTNALSPVRRAGGTGAGHQSSGSGASKRGGVGLDGEAGPTAASGTRDGEGTGSAGVPGGIADNSLPGPSYPRESRLRGEQGTVVVEVSLDPDGMPSLFRIVDDAGFPRLADAALAAVKKARFYPALQDGQPVSSRVRIPFRFRLRAGQ